MKTISFIVAIAAASTVDISAAFSPQTQQAKTQRSQEQHHHHQHQPQKQEVEAPPSRRAFFSRIAGSAFSAALVGGGILQHPEHANAATIKTGAANSFTGDYDDPNHPKCLRQVKVVGGPLNGSGTRSAYPIIEITAWDGNGGESKTCTTRPPTVEDLWQVSGSVRSTSTALVDFSSRGGPDDPLLITYEGGSIVFPDGNKWKKTSEQKDRRPKELSTLSSGPKFREQDDE